MFRLKCPSLPDMNDKPEGDLRSLWKFPVGLLLYIIVVAIIGYFVFYH